MKKLTIGYFADGPWAHKSFKRIIADETLEIKFIVPRTDTADEALLNYSKEYKIPYYKGIKVNSDEFFELASSFNCDLFVSMSFNQIFKNRIINLPKLKTINCHAGNLPFYRGRNVLNWVLINDEKEFGITVHYIDDGIDTGDILVQRVFPISEVDNYSTLLEVAYIECASILYDAIKMIQKGAINPIKQSKIHPVGFYCGIRRIGDEIIDWNSSSRVIFNFIRAICEPGPKATTYKNGVEVKINKARMIENAPSYINTTGQIIGKTKEGFLIKTKDTFIEILEIESKERIRVGDKLGLL
jgi:methionyl-tRNA formyltransferase